MKVTYRNGIPTVASLERIIDNRPGFRISDIYNLEEAQKAKEDYINTHGESLGLIKGA